jgi:hypothetical protein
MNTDTMDFEGCGTLVALFTLNGDYECYPMSSIYQKFRLKLLLIVHRPESTFSAQNPPSKPNPSTLPLINRHQSTPHTSPHEASTLRTPWPKTQRQGPVQPGTFRVWYWQYRMTTGRVLKWIDLSAHDASGLVILGSWDPGIMSHGLLEKWIMIMSRL